MRSGDDRVSSDRMIWQRLGFTTQAVRGGQAGLDRFSPHRPRTFPEGAANNGSLSFSIPLCSSMR